MESRGRLIFKTRMAGGTTSKAGGNLILPPKFIGWPKGLADEGELKYETHTIPYRRRGDDRLYVPELQKVAPNLKGQRIVVYENNGVLTFYKDNENREDDPNENNDEDDNNNNDDADFDEGPQSDGESTHDDTQDPTYNGDDEDMSEDDYVSRDGARKRHCRSPQGVQTPPVPTPRQKRRCSPTAGVATPAAHGAVAPQTEPALPSQPMTSARSGIMPPLASARDEVMSIANELPPPLPPGPLALPPSATAQQTAVVEAVAEPPPAALPPAPMDVELVDIPPAMPDEMLEAPSQPPPAPVDRDPRQDEEIEQLHRELAQKRARVAEVAEKKARIAEEVKQAQRVPVLEKQLAEAQGKLDATQQAVEACQQECAKQLASHNAALQQQASQLAAQHQAAVQQLQSHINRLTAGHNATVQRLQEDNRALQHNVERLKADLRCSLEDNDELYHASV